MTTLAVVLYVLSAGLESIGVVLVIRDVRRNSSAIEGLKDVATQFSVTIVDPANTATDGSTSLDQVEEVGPAVRSILAALREMTSGRSQYWSAGFLVAGLLVGLAANIVSARSPS